MQQSDDPREPIERRRAILGRQFAQRALERPDEVEQSVVQHRRHRRRVRARRRQPRDDIGDELDEVLDRIELTVDERPDERVDGAEDVRGRVGLERRHERVDAADGELSASADELDARFRARWTRSARRERALARSDQRRDGRRRHAACASSTRMLC